MDLPTCKACGQSVLDDDALDCPFCGASMKTGKGGKAPAAGRTAVAKPPAGGAASKSASGAPKSSGRAAPPMGLDDDDEDELSLTAKASSDDPFEVDSSATSGAILLRRAPAKGLSLKLTCPMCETVGYASPKAAGKQVRCANSKCLMPIFTAPAPVEKAAEPPPPAPKKTSPAVLGLAFVLLAGVGAAGAWMAGLFEAEKKRLPQAPVSNVPIVDTPTDPGTTDPTPTEQTPAVTPDPSKTGVAANLETLRKQAFDLMVNAAREQSGQRGKSTARRMAAEAAIRQGNLAEARAQIDQLKKVAGELSFYAVPPLVELGWSELAAGQTDAAKATADEVVAAAKSLPPFGRETAEISPELAAFLAAVGRVNESETILQSLESQPGAGLLTVPMLVSRRSYRYDFEAADAEAPALPWTSPYRVAQTKLLAMHGAWEAALAAAGRARTNEGRAECLTAVAEAITKASDRKPLDLLTKAVAETPAEALSATQARVQAALAVGFAAKDRDAASKALASAHEALKAIPVPADYMLPELKALLEANPPNAAPLRLQALAAADVARADAVLGNVEEGEKSLQTALALARGIGPSLSVARARMAVADANSGSVQDELKSELKLRTNDEARRTFNTYRRQLAEMTTAAEQRLTVQAQILASLARTPLRGVVLDTLQKSEAAASGSRDPLLETIVPWELLETFQRINATDKAAAIQSLVEAGKAAPDPLRELQQKVNQLIRGKQPDQAGQLVDGSSVDKLLRYRLAFRTAAELVNAGQWEASVAFIRGFRNDVIFREEALALTGALAARNPAMAKMVWSSTEMRGLQPSERAALYYGFIVGTVSPPADAPSAARL